MRLKSRLDKLEKSRGGIDQGVVFFVIEENGKYKVTHKDRTLLMSETELANWEAGINERDLVYVIRCVESGQN